MSQWNSGDHVRAAVSWLIRHESDEANPSQYWLAQRSVDLAAAQAHATLAQVLKEEKQ